MINTRSFNSSLLSFDKENGWITGTFRFLNEGIYFMEMCNDGHILKQYNQAAIRGNEQSLIDPDIFNSHEFLSSDRSISGFDWETHVNISIMVYYTPEFAENNKNIYGFIKHILANTNLGSIISLLFYKV